MDMKKILVICTILIAISLAVTAVSAAGSDGKISVDKDKLTIADHSFTIPNGYKEMPSLRDENLESFYDGIYYSACELKNGSKEIIVKVFYTDQMDIDESTYTPGDNAVEKTIGGVGGFLTEENNTCIFDYTTNGHLVEIIAPDEQALEDVLK